MKRIVVALALLWALASGAPAAAHEVRPAYLEITQTGADIYKAVWKLPTMGEVAIHLVPHVSNGWLEPPPSDQYAAAGFLIRTWTVRSNAPDPLAGRDIAIEGLQDTITDVFVRIRLADGRQLDTMLRPQQPSFRITLQTGTAMAVPAFLALGVQHILTGPDHLLFVLGLLLIVRDRRTLVKTVTAFTLAHSLTLGAATLGQLQLPATLLNALIALSIVFVGVEALRARRGDGAASLSLRRPWIMAFGFGLLHGLGFAGGLSTLGLDKVALLSALLLFNVGVEIGQLGFIAVVLALRRSFRLMALNWPRPLALLPSYLVGVLGACWTFQYAAALFGSGR